MITLNEINLTHRSDKGITHNYLNFYEEVFAPLKNDSLSILEIGVLFGNSLKLWNDYFINSKIYGIDDFSQMDGQDFYNHSPVIKEQVFNNLSEYNRIKILDFDCENVGLIYQNLKDMKFDIIIDDASHRLEQQKINYYNYQNYLKQTGIYICEDVQSTQESEELKNYFSSIGQNKKIDILEFNILSKYDDRIIIVR